MQLTSSAFQNDQYIPRKYTCDGEDVSPPLKISDVPNGTKSLVLIMDDPDAPAGVWDHWVVFNIPSEAVAIPECHEPGGVQGKTSFGELGYGGPCPHRGEHRYFFKLYAMDTMLNLPEGVSKAQIGQAMEGHVLARAEVVGRYRRS